MHRSYFPSVLLVGAGVVGRAIAEAHRVRGVTFLLADQDQDALAKASDDYAAIGCEVRQASLPIDGLSSIVVGPKQIEAEQTPLIVIESIVENLAAKQQLFSAMQVELGEDAVLCSNTSTLQIEQIAGTQLSTPGRVCGLHFFMPVHARAAVEVVSGKRSDPDAIAAAVSHAERIGKRPIRCQDGPGFIVNRMLSPYLNQALLLLCRGATESQIERAALAYGMPISPLELIDWIGAMTMFHAGRAFANAFPHRLDASPMVPALVKRKRFGRAAGAGLYDYADGVRSPELADQSRRLLETYRIDDRQFADGEVLRLLSIPMWIEANCLLQEGIAESMETVDLAMAGGLGFTGNKNWSGFFDELGADDIDASIDAWKETFRSMRPTG